MRLVSLTTITAAAAAAILVSVSGAPVDPSSLTTIERVNDYGAIIDSLGRERYFHGVNVVYKAAPYYPITDHFDAQYSFSEEDAKVLQDLNINVIRLGVEWVGTEPTRGTYDQSYLDKIMSIVRMCSKYGIYVLLDMHQDVYSEQFCGEGFPQWTVTPPSLQKVAGFPVPVQKKPFTSDGGIPTPEQCATLDWALAHLTYALAKTYQDLYDNKDGNLDAFAKFWKTVASQFKDEPNLLGYDFINEPWGGNQFKNPSLLIPGVADALNLEQAYNKIAAEVRAVDEAALIFFEGLTLDNGLVGFKNAPGGDNYQNRSVLSYHWYDFGVNVIPIKTTIEANQLSAERLGTAAMLTEFDIAWAGGNLTGALATMKAADSRLQSWIGWEYKSYVHLTGYGASLWDEETSKMRPDMAKLYARTYPSAVQGRTSSFEFDDSTGKFTLTYVADVDNVKGPTEIRVGKTTWYISGLDIKVSASSNSSIVIPGSLTDDGTTVLIALPESIKTGDTITVSLSPK